MKGLGFIREQSAYLTDKIFKQLKKAGFWFQCYKGCLYVIHKRLNFKDKSRLFYKWHKVIEVKKKNQSEFKVKNKMSNLKKPLDVFGSVIQ